MWKYLTNDKYDEMLSSFNLVNTNYMKKMNKLLYGISNNIDSNYDEIIIKKKNKGLRYLSEPSPILKEIQKKILKNVLEEKITSHNSHAYKKGCSAISNAKVHTNCKVILKLDIKNFFDSINFNMVYNSCFNKALYPKKMGMLLTNLCMYNNKLSQGAPTSGYISNIVLRDFDYKVDKYCMKKMINYTRYSDDMTFSGNFEVRPLIKMINKLLYKKGFRLNKSKIKVIWHNTRQQVYYILKYGVDDHIERRNIKLSSHKYLEKLIGKINYILSVNPLDREFISYKTKLMSLKNN